MAKGKSSAKKGGHLPIFWVAIFSDPQRLHIFSMLNWVKPTCRYDEHIAACSQESKVLTALFDNSIVGHWHCWALSYYRCAPMRRT